METFVTNPLCEKWKAVLAQYEMVLTAKTNKMKPDKGKELKKLDLWYQKELPQLITQRNTKHITYEELSKLMKWKLIRGKFRPRLQQFAESNSHDAVSSASKKAFTAMPNVSEALEALCVLKGIGPATASAVLAAGCPERAAFMADESMLALGLLPLTYTMSAYLTFLQQVKAISQKLKEQDNDVVWNTHKVELALWTYHLGNIICPKDLNNALDKDMKKDLNTNVTKSTKRTTQSDADGAVQKKAK